MPPEQAKVFREFLARVIGQDWVDAHPDWVVNWQKGIVGQAFLAGIEFKRREDGPCEG